MIPNFSFLGREFSAYQICVLVGVLSAVFFVFFLAQKKKCDDYIALIMMLWAALGAALGGVLLYGITNLPLIADVLQNWSQLTGAERTAGLTAAFRGSVFYGGLLGGLALAFSYLKCKKADLRTYSDLGAVGIPLFHTFGRLGCFLTGCCYGVECKTGFVYHYAPHAAANGVSRFPVQLVEMGLNLGLFILLLCLLLKGKAKGRLLQLYLLIYPVYRFILEFFRGDDYRGFLFGLSTSQIISILILLGNLIFTLCNRNGKKKEADPC